HGSEGASWVQRHILRYWDAVPAPADRPRLPTLKVSRWLAQTSRQLLVKGTSLLDPVAAHISEPARARLQAQLEAFGSALNRWDVRLTRVENLLRVYKPFIHDNDYRFVSRNIRDLLATLPAAERTEFELLIDTLDWREYWLDIEAPGLERWCF